MHSTDPSRSSRPQALEIKGLNVHYGQAHALQDVSLSLGQGVLAVVGRNGMGKTTLCKAITGMVPGTGSIQFEGRELIALPPNDITHLGVAYVPQGRRVWRSLTVDETLRLAAKTARQGAWTVDRVYQAFPRLAERRGNGGAQLSGGEQQMLAIGRALLFNPRLLVMDEPTEGLAPVIVEQVANLLTGLAKDGSMSILLIEQNLGVALEVADRIAVMVNGRIAHTLPSAQLAADKELQRRLLGVGTGSHGDDATEAEKVHGGSGDTPVYTLVRASHSASGSAPAAISLPRSHHPSTSKATDPVAVPAQAGAKTPKPGSRTFKPATGQRGAAYVVGTYDTKGEQLQFIRRCLDRRGLRTVTVDISTTTASLTANVSAREVARHHPQGERAVFAADGKVSGVAMAEAFEHFLLSRDDLAGVISFGGPTGSSLALPGLGALPVGLPKFMVTTGEPSQKSWDGARRSDICMVFASDDAGNAGAGMEQTLSNAGHALAGMMGHAVRMPAPARG